MFERQERMAILLLIGVAIAVIVAHIVLTGLGKQPFARPFTNSSADGELVVVEGQIDQITLTQSGGHMTVSVNNLSVFLPAQVVQAVSPAERRPDLGVRDCPDLSGKKGDRRECCRRHPASPGKIPVAVS